MAFDSITKAFHSRELAYLTATAAGAAVLYGLWLRGQQSAGSQNEDDHATKHAVFLDPDMPVDAAGRTYHLQTKPGDVAARVLSVGDVGRAERIASLMSDRRTFVSSRGFVTHTGTYKGKLVSIVATGMGYPMADFVVRECRAVVTGPMAFLRFGTCGGLGQTVPGTVVVAGEGSVLVRREPDAVGEAIAAGTAGLPSPISGPVGTPSADFPYSVSKPVYPDGRLTAGYVAALKKEIEPMGPAFPVKTGMDATADSFYSSQGRKGRAFFDRNDSVLDRLTAGIPGLATLQMETFHLLDLARASRPEGPVYASAAAIVLVNRNSAAVVSKEDMHTLEVAGGRAALEALAAFDM